MKFLMTYENDRTAAPPTPEKMAAIGKFSQDMMARGILVMTGGLVRPSKGTKVKQANGKFTVTDGPYPETKELIDGFALVEVESHDHAVAVAKEFMALAGDGTGEILQVFDPGGPPR